MLFRDNRYNRYIRSQKNESVANPNGLIEASLHILVKMRVDFGRGLRLVGDPEAIDVLQTTLATQPRLSETLERVPTHSRFVQPHFL